MTARPSLKSLGAPGRHCSSSLTRPMTEPRRVSRLPMMALFRQFPVAIPGEGLDICQRFRLGGEAGVRRAVLQANGSALAGFTGGRMRADCSGDQLRGKRPFTQFVSHAHRLQHGFRTYFSFAAWLSFSWVTFRCCKACGPSDSLAKRWTAVPAIRDIPARCPRQRRCIEPL
jgi:hypothetical protein